MHDLPEALRRYVLSTDSNMIRVESLAQLEFTSRQGFTHIFLSPRASTDLDDTLSAVSEIARRALCESCLKVHPFRHSNLNIQIHGLGK